MILVYGLQKSGISVAKLLEKKNKDFKIWDDNKLVRKNLKSIFDHQLFFKPNTKNLKYFNKIFVSPGISLRQKKFKLLNNKNQLQRDINLYISNLKKEKIIGITGTNGKSTTTKLIGDVLKKNKIKTFVGGNIGKPLCNAYNNNRRFNYHVIELSSFQLETIKNLKSKISIITNLSNDHQDRYKNIYDYINQKINILTKTGINIISVDDVYSKKIYLKKNINNKISFSIVDPNADVYMEDNFILDNYFLKNKKIFINKISQDLNGKFNNQNILIAYICCRILKIPIKIFINTVQNFKGLPFRSKIIYNNKKLKIINNSKSTNLNSAINSIKNYKNIYLILGGIAKENNFEVLSNFKKNISLVYVFGKSAPIIENKLKNFFSVKRFKNLKLVVKQITNDVKLNKNQSLILFSPACSSYDQYNNFEHRGEDFTKLIKKYLLKK